MDVTHHLHHGTNPVPAIAWEDRHLLPLEDMDASPAELWQLLEEHTRRYLMGESSSLPVETATGLLESIVFTLRLGGVGHHSLAARFQAGQNEIEALMEKGRLLLHRVRRSALDLPNQGYQDTLRGLPAFFSRYDFCYFAREIPCDIDYPLLCPVSDSLSGILWFNDYLRRLCAENLFLRKFRRDRIIPLLQAWCDDPAGLLINLFQPVYQAALGLALLGRDIPLLSLTGAHQEELYHRFAGTDPLPLCRQGGGPSLP